MGRRLTVVLAAGVLAAALVGVSDSAVAAATYKCFGKAATIVGTGGHDVIEGTDGNDVIVGLGGSDEIYGRGGHDRICGGRQHDRIWGGPGRDRILGQQGDDRLYGGRGRDVLRGGYGRDRLSGNAFKDVLRGGPHADILSGGWHDDSVGGGQGGDALQHNHGDDIMDGGRPGPHVDDYWEYERIAFGPNSDYGLDLLYYGPIEGFPGSKPSSVYVDLAAQTMRTAYGSPTVKNFTAVNIDLFPDEAHPTGPFELVAYGNEHRNMIHLRPCRGGTAFAHGRQGGDLIDLMGGGWGSPQGLGSCSRPQRLDVAGGDGSDEIRVSYTSTEGGLLQGGRGNDWIRPVDDQHEGFVLDGGEGRDHLEAYETDGGPDADVCAGTVVHNCETTYENTTGCEICAVPWRSD